MHSVVEIWRLQIHKRSKLCYLKDSIYGIATQYVEIQFQVLYMLCTYSGDVIVQ